MTNTTLDLETVVLSYGAHDAESGEHCLLEVVSMFAGEPFGDSPICVDPVLAAFGRAWNDCMRTNEERAQLKQYIPLLVGTAGSKELSEKRAWMAFDWLVRVNCATWLALTPEMKVHADILVSLPAITCKAELDIALPRINAAGAAAWDAGAAAGDAAWAAWAAAGASLEPTVKTLQASAHDLFARMIAAK